VTAAAVVLLYSVVVAWRIPSILARLSATGTKPRLGIAVWLTAMASVLVSGGVSLYFLIRAAVSGWTHLAVVICKSVSGGVCTPVVYTSALTALALGFAAAAGIGIAAALSWRCARRMRQAHRQTRAHADTARLAGRQLAPNAFVLDVPQLAAYCVPPDIIVVTTGALGVLAPAQLDAVLAHERAHLAGRHHLVTAITRGLAATFPAVPLFVRGKDEIARLAEMCADDAAARRTGRRPLVEALLALGTGAAVTSPALAAAGYAVAARVDRLLAPAPRGSLVRTAAGLAVVLAALPVLSGLVILYAGAA
jgi:Zn-dependent protease with chaperone function